MTIVNWVWEEEFHRNNHCLCSQPLLPKLFIKTCFYPRQISILSITLGLLGKKKTEEVPLILKEEKLPWWWWMGLLRRKKWSISRKRENSHLSLMINSRFKGHSNQRSCLTNQLFIFLVHLNSSCLIIKLSQFLSNSSYQASLIRKHLIWSPLPFSHLSLVNLFNIRIKQTMLTSFYKQSLHLLESLISHLSCQLISCKIQTLLNLRTNILSIRIEKFLYLQIRIQRKIQSPKIISSLKSGNRNLHLKVLLR